MANEKNLAPQFSNSHQPTGEARERGERLRRIKRDPLTECIRDYVTCTLTPSGNLPAHILGQYNPNVLAIVSDLMGTAKGEGKGLEDLTAGQRASHAQSARVMIFNRLVGTPPRAVPDEPAGDEIPEDVTLVPRKENVPLPIHDAEEGLEDRTDVDTPMATRSGPPLSLN